MKMFSGGILIFDLLPHDWYSCLAKILKKYKSTHTNMYKSAIYLRVNDNC